MIMYDDVQDISIWQPVDGGDSGALQRNLV